MTIFPNGWVRARLTARPMTERLGPIQVPSVRLGVLASISLCNSALSFVCTVLSPQSVARRRDHGKRLRQQQATRRCHRSAVQPATTVAHVAWSSHNQAPSPWNQHEQQSDRRSEEVFGISQDLAYPMRDCRCGLQSRRVESGPLWTVAFIVFNVVGFKKRHFTRAQNGAWIVQRKENHSRNWQALKDKLTV